MFFSYYDSVNNLLSFHIKVTLRVQVNCVLRIFNDAYHNTSTRLIYMKKPTLIETAKFKTHSSHWVFIEAINQRG